jgi:hypothetical protein
MKTPLLFLSLCVFALGSKAQYNGMTLYGHAGSPAILSSGNITSIHSNGFLLGGYDPNTVSTGDNNLYIDKTGPRGLFAPMTLPFRKWYRVNVAPPCLAANAQLLTSYGLSVIETSTISTPYMMTAAFDEGFVVTGLDIAGDPIFPSCFFPFPATASAPSKPLITESPANPNYFYAVTSYYDSGTSRRYLWVVLVDGSGNLAWSTTYELGNANTSLEPRAIIEPSSFPAELVIVGIGDSNDPSLGREGFFIRIDGDPNGTGNVLFSQFIGGGGTITPGSHEEFHSVTEVQGAISGFLIGGYTDSNPTQGTSWMLTLNTAATNTIWSSQILPGTPNGDGPVVGVSYRNSAIFGDEFYGVSRSAAGSVVSKLESGGAAFSSFPSEFLYNPSDPSVSEPVAITNINIPGDINEGIHIYGTNGSAPPGTQFYLTNAFFNGTAGDCSNTGPVRQFMDNIAGITNAPGTFSNIQVSRASGPGTCAAHTVSNTPFVSAGISLCPFLGDPGSPYSGDNSRIAMPTGLQTEHRNASQVSIQPNPVQESVSIRYSITGKETVKIELFNSLGQHIKTLSPAAQPGANETGIDFSSLGVESGIYFIHTTIGQSTDKQKVIYRK